MGSLNRVMVIGNLGRDAELRYTQGGTAVATLNMATTEKWKGRDGQMQEKTEWHRVTLWGKTAEALQQYLTKGKQIYVEGRLQTRKWQDRDGNDKYTTEVVADKVVLLGGGKGNGESRRPADIDPLGGSSDFGNGGTGGSGAGPITDDDIPF